MFKRIYNHIMSSRFAPLYILGIFIILCFIVGAIVFLCTPDVHLNFPLK